MSLPENYTALLAQGKGKDATLGQVPLQKPGKNQILVKMAFAPINPTETLTISGAYPLPGPGPYRVGFEGAGTVAAVGEDLTTPFQVGDRVHVRGLGTVGQYILADASVCRKVQEGLSLEEAASHFTNPATVVCMADYVTKNGHKAVIQSAAASALGKMFIRLLKHKGVKSINIVRRDDLFEELKKEGADYVLNSQAPDFEAQLKEIAHKENATVSFDAIAGDFTAKILKNQPADSVCAIYGLLGGFDVPNLSVQQFIFEGKTLRGFNVQTYLEKATKAGEGTKLLDEVYGLLPTVLKTNVQKVFKLEEFKEALACYEQNSTKGKVLIQLS